METQQQTPNSAGPVGQGGSAPAGGAGIFKQMEGFFETYLHKKAPFHIPTQAREWIVKYGPWIDLVLLVLALPVIVAALGISLLFFPFATVFKPFASVFGIINWLIILAAFVLEIAALPGLFKRSLKSWYLVYYAVLIGALGDLLDRDIFSFVVGTAISLYILFEVKEYYRPLAKSK